MNQLLLNSVLAVLPGNVFLAQASDYQTAAPQAASPLSMIISLAIAVLIIAAMWKVFTKAGQPGWACLIPIYNLYVLCKIAGRPGWWLLLMLIPIVNFIIIIILCIDIYNRSISCGYLFMTHSSGCAHTGKYTRRK